MGRLGRPLTLPTQPPLTFARVTIDAVLAAAVPVDASFTFAPVVLLALAGYGYVYTRRWRTAHAEGGDRAAPRWRLALWWAGIAGARSSR